MHAFGIWKCASRAVEESSELTAIRLTVSFNIWRKKGHAPLRRQVSEASHGSTSFAAIESGKADYLAFKMRQGLFFTSLFCCCVPLRLGIILAALSGSDVMCSQDPDLQLTHAVNKIIGPMRGNHSHKSFSLPRQCRK